MKEIRKCGFSNRQSGMAVSIIFLLLVMIPWEVSAKSVLDEIDINVSESELLEMSESQKKEKMLDKLEKDKVKLIKTQTWLKAQNDRRMTDLIDKIDYRIFETETWINEHRERLLNIMIVIAIIIILYVIYWRLNRIKVKLEDHAKVINQYTDEMEKILGKGKRLQFVTWKDQKEGILFIPNPMHSKRKKRRGDKKEELKEELKKLKKKLIKKSDDIDDLKERLKIYLDTIERLNQEYEDNKKQIINENRFHVTGDQVTKEFR